MVYNRERTISSTNCAVKTEESHKKKKLNDNIRQNSALDSSQAGLKTYIHKDPVKAVGRIIYPVKMLPLKKTQKPKNPSKKKSKSPSNHNTSNP